MARLFNYPPKDLEQRLQGQSELLLEFVAWAKEMNAAMAAHRALAQALIATHPHPHAVLDQFQQGMDWVADAVNPDQIADYRKEMQLLQNMLLQATNRAKKP